MKKYWLVAKLTWQEYLAYRMNFWLEIIGGLITMLITIALWYYIYQSQALDIIGGYTLKQMITYLLGAGLINSFILLTAQGDEINDDINQGLLSINLVRPVNPTMWWLTRDLCRRVITLLLGLISFIFIVIFLFDFLIAPQNIILVILAIIVAALIHFLIFYLGSIIAFWFEQTWGPRFVVRRVMEIASGALIPLTLFPGSLQKIFFALPFKFVNWLPMQIYLDKLTYAEILFYAGEACLWILGLLLVVYIVYKRGIKRYAGEGI